MFFVDNFFNVSFGIRNNNINQLNNQNINNLNIKNIKSINIFY